MLSADYVNSCREHAEPAVIVTLSAPPALSVNLESTGKRLSERRRDGLENLLRRLSSANAIAFVGPVAARTDWLADGLDVGDVAAQVVAYLADTQPDELVQPVPDLAPATGLRPKPHTFNEWLNDAVDNLVSGIEFIEEMLIRQLP